MRIPLNNLDSIKAQEFLSYFTAALKKRSGSPFLGSSSAKFNESGQYETFIDDFVTTNNGEGTAISWKIIQSVEGHISEIEATSNSEINIDLCSNFINEFIREVLTATLGGKRATFFYRKPFCYIGHANLNGEYWITNQTRIAPLQIDDISWLVNAERIIVVDQSVEAIDNSHALILGEEQANKISAHLSFILDIGLYEVRNEARWIVRQDAEGNIISERNNLGIWDTSGQHSMPQKGELCGLNEPTESIYNIERHLGVPFNFPKETRNILKGIAKADPSVILAFDRSTRLYQTALVAGRYYPTIRLAYLYGSIDAITKSIKDYKGFSEFMRKFCPEAQNSFLEFMHEKVRSAHWHSGEFVMGETESRFKETMLDPASHIRFNIRRLGHKYIRTAILNWIFEELKINSVT